MKYSASSGDRGRCPSTVTYTGLVVPFVVFTLVWFINPDYMGGFFADQRLMVAGLGGLLWMGIGAFIMAKMVDFEI